MARIVLIGPIASGKSSVARHLSDRTGWRNVSLDDVRWAYYFQIGFDFAEQRRRVRSQGRSAMFDYWKPFEAHAVERVLADFPDDIIDFGAGHSIQDDPALFAKVVAALAPERHVVLLRPSVDIEESLAIISERIPEEHREEVATMNREFLTSPCNARLATMTVHTGRRTSEAVCEEILERIGWTALEGVPNA